MVTESFLEFFFELADLGGGGEQLDVQFHLLIFHNTFRFKISFQGKQCMGVLDFLVNLERLIADDHTEILLLVETEITVDLAPQMRKGGILREREFLYFVLPHILHLDVDTR